MSEDLKRYEIAQATKAFRFIVKYPFITDSTKFALLLEIDAIVKAWKEDGIYN